MAIIPAEEKVFMVSNSTNTTYSGSAALKAMQQWYTMEDVTNTVRPYKVFTALLTQSGGNDEQIISSGPVTEGVTYLIDGADGTDDFSNVGGPAAGTGNGKYFIAINNNVPNSYGDADLVDNNGAPVATVLENTIGNIWFTYQNYGEYIASSDNLFISNKTSVFGGYYDSDAGNGFVFGTGGDSVNQIFLFTNDGSRADNILQNVTIEIRVYN